MKTFSAEALLLYWLCKGIGVAKGVREGSVCNPELQLTVKEKCYGLNFKVAPQPCHTWEHGCLPYAKHLRSQLTVAINTHGALSHGEHYHTTELQIPNLGSEAPWLSAHWGRGGSIKQDWHWEQDVWVTCLCSSEPTWEHDEQHPHSLGMTLTHDEPLSDLLSFRCSAWSTWAH